MIDEERYLDDISSYDFSKTHDESKFPKNDASIAVGGQKSIILN